VSAKIGTELDDVFDEFEAIAPRIFGVEAARAKQLGIVHDRNASRREHGAQTVEIGDCKGGVRFLSRAIIAFDADVKLLAATLEPAASPRTQDPRLFDFVHAENRAVKFPRGSFATFRRGDLDMIYASDPWLHANQIITRENPPISGATPRKNTKITED
jgi:hypothetical protein